MAFTDKFYRDELSLFLLEEFIVLSYYYSTRYNTYRTLPSEFQADMSTFYKLIKMNMKDALMFDFIS